MPPACYSEEAWLEEEIAAGRIPFPGGYRAFLLNRNAASRAFWIGAPKPVADDLKSAKAHQVYRDMGVITDEMIETGAGFITMSEIVNFLIAGGAAYFSYAQGFRELADKDRPGLL